METLHPWAEWRTTGGPVEKRFLFVEPIDGGFECRVSGYKFKSRRFTCNSIGGIRAVVESMRWAFGHQWKLHSCRQVPHREIYGKLRADQRQQLGLFPASTVPLVPRRGWLYG